jgi:Cys-tRNA(Pro) deacylase
MLIHPEKPDLFLVEVADVLASPPPEPIREAIEPLSRIVAWARDFLCNSHPELGREGPVCPYVEASMRKCSFYLTVRRGRDYAPADVEAVIRDLRDWFLAIEPQSGPNRTFKTILCLFPDLAREDLPALIDGVQEKLKREYVQLGVMVGEFHDRPPEKAGLWNPHFRPLAAPVPMLVVRHMVATDFAFLKDDREFLRHYLERFGADVPAHLRQEVAAAAARLGLAFADERELPRVHRRVRRALEAHGVEARVWRHRDLGRPIGSPRDFAAAAGVGLERLTKALFLRSREHRYVVLLAPVIERVNLKALAADLGSSRLELADVEELAAYLDYSPGGVSPIGVDAEIPVYIDPALMRQPTVFVAAGEVAVEIELKPEDLRRMTRGQVRALTESSREASRATSEVERA